MVLRTDWRDGSGGQALSTKIGIITEGAIDDVLLPALLERIARVRANYRWPVMPDDLGEIIRLRKRGHGGVIDSVRRLVNYLEKNPPTDHSFFVILLDRKTKEAQEEVRKLIRGRSLFRLGIAIEEIEAWWLADRENTLSWLRLPDHPKPEYRYWSRNYRAEKDNNPKKTLDELTELSSHLNQRYGGGNKQLAVEFAEHWKSFASLNQIERDCPKGFKPFCRGITEALVREKKRLGHLF